MTATMPLGRPGVHVCFVAMHIFPTMCGNSQSEVVGGAEVQQTILARALVRAGCRVSVLTGDYGQDALVDCDGVQVHRVRHAGTRGLKGLRFLHPHMTDIVAGLRNIDPDVVYFRTAGFRAAAAAWYARRAGKPFVYACASDMELLPEPKEPTTRRDAFLFRLALRSADRILVQNGQQLQMLKENAGLPGLVLANCYDEPTAGVADQDGPVLWVGTVKPIKRPELFIELARRFPHRRFRMVGGANRQDAAGSEYFDRIRRVAQSIPNLDMVGHVPFKTVGKQFDGASVLVNTSETEGFPNTFLQAWIRGVPSLSFVAPEVVPGASGTIACADLEDMAVQLKQLLGDAAIWRTRSHACRIHFDRVHSVESAMMGYRELFDQLLQRPEPQRA